MQLTEAKILELAYQPELAIAQLTAVFDRQEQEKFDVAVEVADLPTIARLENIGFQLRRQFNSGKTRMQRMRLDRFSFIQTQAEIKIAEHLDPAIWSFGFDSAKRRAGLCDYTNSKITISKYFAQIHSVDETMQVVLHEIAHGICGKKAGHTKKWLTVAKSIGYRAEKFTGTQIAAETARWVGTCAAGHAHYRYRKPTRPMSCALCSPKYSRFHLIGWNEREL